MILIIIVNWQCHLDIHLALGRKAVGFLATEHLQLIFQQGSAKVSHDVYCRPFNRFGWKVAFALNYFIAVVYAGFTVGGIFFSIQRIVQQVRTNSGISILANFDQF